MDLIDYSDIEKPIAVLVAVSYQGQPYSEDIHEFKELVTSTGATIGSLITAVRDHPDARTYVGSGKLHEIKQVVDLNKANLVIFNNELTPAQERNIERYLVTRVINRTRLILDIFAQRARTHEGKLQVELAQLQHLSTRLVRGWTHLERQKGGIGLRGPGETQLETDRRLLSARISKIRKRLQKVDVRRELGRKARKRNSVPTISLVGYTNAGKSTLFNRLTTADVYVKDQLFATLDPTLRQIALPGKMKGVLVDTVGFISDLPHELVAAFKSTLQESIDASLILHVIDAASPNHQVQKAEVEAVLKQIGANRVKIIEVFNKIDLLDTLSVHQDMANGKTTRIWISAKTGEGIDQLLGAIENHVLTRDLVSTQIILRPEQGALHAALHREAEIHFEEYQEQGDCKIAFSLPRRSFEQLKKRYLMLDQLIV